MATYHYVCDGKDCGYCPITVDAPFGKPPEPEAVSCPKCQGPTYRDFSGVQVATFKPWTDWVSGDRPVQIDSRAQEREHLREHGLTYEPEAKPKPTPLSKAVTPDMVYEHLNKYGPTQPDKEPEFVVPSTQTLEIS